MKALKCNKCGKVITSSVEIKTTTNILLKSEGVGIYSDDIHLCEKCIDLLYDWIEAPIE